MDINSRLQLNRLIKENDVEDFTKDIREKKHSQIIKKEIDKLLDLKKNYKRLSKTNPDIYENMLIKDCNFLFNNYTDIFNKIKKDELNLSIMWKLLTVLKKIEDGIVDQHEGSFEVGKILKELYIDSANIRGKKMEEKEEKIRKKKNQKQRQSNPPIKKISWKEYKKMNNITTL